MPAPTQIAPTLALPMLISTRLLGDGKHGQAERIQTYRCQACHSTFSARRHTPLYRLKTPSHQVAVVLSGALGGFPKGWTLPQQSGSQGYRQATITTWLSRAARARTHLARA